MEPSPTAYGLAAISKLWENDPAPTCLGTIPARDLVALGYAEITNDHGGSVVMARLTHSGAEVARLAFAGD